jgi:hypothetical protein
MICPSCGHDNRDKKTEQVIYTPKRVGSDNSDQTAKSSSNISKFRERTASDLEDDLLLRRWLGILFWLSILSIIGSIMSQYVSSLALVGIVIKGLSSLAYGLILLRLSEVESCYQKAGILFLVYMGLSFLSLLNITLAMLIAIPALIVALFSLNYEICGHSYVLAGVNDVLSRNWDDLWKWTLRSYIGLIVAVLLGFFSHLLANIVLFIATVGLIIVSIIKIVYLYQTARSFKGRGMVP